MTSPLSLFSHPLLSSETLTIVVNNAYHSALEGNGIIPAYVFAEAFILFIIIGIVNIAARTFMASRGSASSGGNNQ
jgi:ABC-type phosphate transport system permease subunit